MKMALTALAFFTLLGSAAPVRAEPSAAPAAAPKFTVEEERTYTKFEAETLPQWNKDLEAGAGVAIPITIEWATFAGDEKVWGYLFSVSALRCPVDALIATCADAVGKKRLTAVVKKLVLKHDRTITDQPDKPGKGLKVELKDGTLTITDNWGLNHLMTGDVQPLVEKLL